MVGLGIVSLDQAYRAIDFDTITLLLGMVIVVANVRVSGFFRLVSNWVVARARTSHQTGPLVPALECRRYRRPGDTRAASSRGTLEHFRQQGKIAR
jgi:hypothetical protein